MDARTIRTTAFVAIAAAALLVAVAVLWRGSDGLRSDDAPNRGSDSSLVAAGETSDGGKDKTSETSGSADFEVAKNSSHSEAEAPKTADEFQKEEEKRVEAFDSLTDEWMEKEGGEVTMKDMDNFVAAFKSIPASRKDECLHRALNLVSDDHVLLLAGILLDKSIDREYLELVFNDVLNRNEEVKKLILPKIFKDKTHPCWADTAWILDVTGELPKKEKKP